MTRRRFYAPPDAFEAEGTSATLGPDETQHLRNVLRLKTGDEVYLRFHGTKRWYRHDYSDEELNTWVDKIRFSGAKRAWIYFNNDYGGFAPRNALTMWTLLEGARS